jgi:NAD(P)-dependent dehydrogenase (short-subunit alcohol dehydrogenase family)
MSPVLLLFGAGANVGTALAKKFTQEGWKVATVARTTRDDIKANSALNIQADFVDPNSVAKAYEEVETKLGTPNVVVYNGMYKY